MLTVTINGRAYGPREVRDELSMNDFLREYLGMTGTKFGCGAAQCLSCAVIVDNPNGTSYTSGPLNMDEANPSEDPPHGRWGILNDARVGGHMKAFMTPGVWCA